VRIDRVPAAVRQVAVPKRNGVRLLTRLDPATEVRYVSLVAAAVPAIEAALRPVVVANRVRRASVRPPMLRLEPTAEARERFVTMASELCRAPFVVVADVENCYPSVGLDALATVLERRGVSRGTRQALLALLARLSAFGVRGLPVGPLPSAILANAVLAAVDDELARAGRRYVRWVDDVWVAATSWADAEGILAVLEAALGGVGLRLSARKTRIAVSTDVSPRAVSPVGSQYHRPADAHPLPGVARPDAVAPGRG